jgi:hypothetical protein
MATHTLRAEQFTVPGPEPVPALPRLGNVLQFARDPIDHLSWLCDHYGNIVSLAEVGRTHTLSPVPYTPGTVFLRGSEFLRQLETNHDSLFKYALRSPLSARTGSPSSEKGAVALDDRSI